MSKTTVDVLRLLREETSNIRLGVITNGSATVQRQKLAACGAASMMDVIFIGDDVETCLRTKQAFRDDDIDASVTKSGDDCESKLLHGEEKDDGGFPVKSAASSSSTTPIFIHRAKPCPSIFQAACAAVGCTPGEAIMVGDSLEMDVRGAENAGFAAGVLVTEGKDEEEEKEEGQHPHIVLSAQRLHDGDFKEKFTDDGESTACCARDTQMNKDGNASKALFLQCTTVSQVPNLLRERRLLF